MGLPITLSPRPLLIGQTGTGWYNPSRPLDSRLLVGRAQPGPRRFGPTRHGHAKSHSTAGCHPGAIIASSETRQPPARNFLTLIISSAAEVIPATTATTAGAGEICARGASFIDGQRPAIERLSIQAGDCPLNILAFAEFDKAEAARRPCHLVANHHGGGHLKARIGYKFGKSCIGRAMG